MLRHWRRWLIAAGSVLVVLAAIFAWWYQDRSDLEAAIAEAERLGLPLEPELVTRSAQRQTALNALRAMSVASDVYDEHGYGFISLRGWPDEQEALLAHWRAMPPERVAAVDAAIDAVGPGPLWPTASQEGSDIDLDAWHRQRLLTCAPAEFSQVFVRAYTSTGWDEPIQAAEDRNRLRGRLVSYIAVRRTELEPQVLELARMLDDAAEDVVGEYRAAQRAAFGEVLRDLRRGEKFDWVLGLRLPTVVEWCFPIIDRAQTPDLITAWSAWLVELDGLSDMDLVRERCGLRYGRYARMRSWMDIFDLEVLATPSTSHPSRISVVRGYWYAAYCADLRLALRAMANELRGEPWPVDPIDGAPFIDGVRKTYRAMIGTADPWYSLRSTRHISLHPVVAPSTTAP